MALFTFTKDLKNQPHWEHFGVHLGVHGGPGPGGSPEPCLVKYHDHQKHKVFCRRSKKTSVECVKLGKNIEISTSLSLG